MNIEKFQYVISRFLLLFIYLSYFIVAFAVNIDRIEDRFDLFSVFKQDIRQILPGVYSGSFKNEKNMLKIINRYKIKRVISLMDPRLPAY
ncbi:MAG: hypothetical protein IE880_06795, partial [Epsilonproteobacteria bacterium]|nr:hypothetical protein [Campylobacterota bacterium]